MTTSPLRQTRGWVVTAAGLSQVAATKAGMLPWWALPVTILLTVAVARQTGPISEQRAKTTRGVAVTAVAGFTVFIAAKAIAAGGDGADPLGTMRLLTEALVVLSLAMAPTWRTTHDYRLWLSVTTGVLVAATVGSHNIATDVLLVGAWIVTLLAMASVQGAALVAAVTPQAGATPAVPPASRPAWGGDAGRSVTDRWRARLPRLTCRSRWRQSGRHLVHHPAK